MKFFLFVLLILTTASSNALSLQKYHKKPKLVVLLVIDQFRADYLTKYKNEFVAVGAKGEVGGFNYLMEQGAYFPFAQYDVLQSMTCPGHAMISTGTHPYLNGISLNNWYDTRLRKGVYCTDDSEYGASPRRLVTTTFGDELKNISEASKVVALALKDRSAVMLGGHRADAAVWMDMNEYRWVTSKYYRQGLPAWAQEVNTALSKAGVLKKENQDESKKALLTPYGAKVTRQIAEAALKGENLGKNGRTDILAVSFSSHDMAGHQYGPNSPELRSMTLAEDKEISLLLTTIKKHLGSLQDVTIALTADHGVAPSVEYAKAANIESERLDYLAMYKKLNERLDKKFGKPRAEWFLAGIVFNFYVNPDAVKERKAKIEDVHAEIKEVMKTLPGVFDVTTDSEISLNRLPTGELGNQLTRQYIRGNNGDVILIPKPFYISKGESVVNHMTGYSYDRTVPLILLGPNIKPGVYSSNAKVIDLAPTLTFMMGALPPASATGRILNEIFN